MSIKDRFQKAWSAFFNRAPTETGEVGYGFSSSYRPDAYRLSLVNARTLMAPVLNRIAIDVAATNIIHARVDENGQYVETIESTLNNAMSVEANVDQTGRSFFQDLTLSMFDEGCVAVVPTVCDVDPNRNSSFKIHELRVGKIMTWYPAHVQVRVYNEDTGMKEDIIVKKSTTAIIENPFYSIMNSPNSTLKRLLHKIALLDSLDDDNYSGKLNMLLQFPYSIKSDQRRTMADKRRKDIEDQLTNSPYGIAYIDGTERVTQLNRPLENNLMDQIKYLTDLFYSQIGITSTILDGTADEQTLTNYNNRTLEPILSAITDEFTRKFLTKTARTQRQCVKYISEPFKLAPVAQISEIADKFTRNEILTSNEIRSIVGFKPSSDPRADELRNKNLNRDKNEIPTDMPLSEMTESGEEMTAETDTGAEIDPKSVAINLDDESEV